MKELKDKYPEIFNPKPYCIGYELEEQWVSIIDKMCKNMMKYYKANPEIPIQRCVQMKEKFGTLRFYLEAYTDELGKIIRKAEIATTKICQFCGSKNNVKPTQPWVRYLCKECREPK
jgi:hypothetical protein